MLEEPFNKLTPAEAERLDLLAEECAEVIQAIAKIKRHGYDSYHPENPALSNRAHLEREIGHMSAAVDLMRFRADVTVQAIHAAATFKLRTVGQWLHHNDTKDIL